MLTSENWLTLRDREGMRNLEGIGNYGRFSLPKVGGNRLRSVGNTDCQLPLPFHSKIEFNDLCCHPKNFTGNTNLYNKMSASERLQKLSELREYVSRICCSEIKLSKDWYENMEEVANFLLASKEDTNLKRKLREFIARSYKEQESKQLAKNLTAVLTEKRRKLHELHNEKERLKNEYEKLEQKMNSDDKISDSQRKKLLRFESMVQACKILTGTEFEYGCSDTSGYMYNESTGVLKAFSLDSTNGKQKEYLWSLMSKVYPVKADVK